MRFTLSNRTVAHTLAILTFAFLFFVAVANPAYAQETDWFASMANTAFKAIAELIYSVFLMIGGVVAGAGGQLLDIAISLTILNMGTVYQMGVGFGIEALWKVIRDILNILFIFGLIFIGIKTILNSEDSGTRRALGLLIVSALLINFSLFITLAIIDFSNVAAVQIYNQILNGAAGAGEVATEVGGATGITWIFVDIANLTTLFGGQDALADLDAISIIAYAVFMLFFLLFAGIIFFMGAFLLMSRFVALVIYTIISPVMFLGWILPSLQGHSKKWWRGFIKQAFFAPAFLFMLYLSVVVLQRLNTYLMTNTNFFPANAGYGNMMAGGDMFSQQMGLIFMFCMTIGFLYASMKVGQMMSVAGANSTMKMTDNARRGIQGFAYRNTAGRRFAALGRSLERADRSIAANQLDPNRRPSTVRKISDNFVRSAITGPTSAGQRMVTSAATYGAGGKNLKTVQDEKKGRQDTIAARDAEVAKSIELKNVMEKRASAPYTSEGNEARTAFENVIKKTSDKELIALASSPDGIQLLQKVASSIPESKFSSLMDSDDLSTEDKDSLKRARKETTKASLTEGNIKKLSAGIPGASADQLANLDFDELSQNAAYVQAGQIEKLEGKWGEEKLNSFKERRKQELEKKFSEGREGIEEILTTRKGEKEIGKLPNELFTKHKDAFLEYTLSKDSKVKLTGGLMQHIAGESGITGTDKKAFGAAVVALEGDALSDDLKNFFKSPAGGAFGVNIDALKSRSGGSKMDQSV